MSYTPTEQAAIDRLKTKYNSNAYNAATNPGGFANDGHQVNFPAALADTGNAAAAVGVKADEVGANKIATDAARAAAEQAEADAATHSSNAEAAKNDAQAARDVATTRKNEAETARDIANTKKEEAEAAQTAAAASATNAAGSEAGAQAAKVDTEAARDVANTRKIEAEAARDAAGASATASAGSAAASDSFADDAALSAGASANSAAASESSRQVAETAKNDALAALASANLPTPIVNDRMLLTEGGAYVFKERFVVGRALAAVHVFDTPYTSSDTIIGNGDHGKSYDVNLGSVSTVKLANIATLGLGWSVSIRVQGIPAAHQLAKLLLLDGAFLYAGNGHGSNFFLLGNGEELKLTKINAGYIEVQVLGQPSPQLIDGYNTGGAGWNSGATSWFPLPTNAYTGQTHIWSAANGRTVSASGVYHIDAKVFFSNQTSGTSTYAYLAVEADGYTRQYIWKKMEYNNYETLACSTTVRLQQGDVLTANILMGASYIYYSPYSGDTRQVISLVSR